MVVVSIKQKLHVLLLAGLSVQPGLGRAGAEVKGLNPMNGGGTPNKWFSCWGPSKTYLDYPQKRDTSPK